MIRTALVFVCVLFISCAPDRAKVSHEEAIAAAKKLEDYVKGGNVDGLAAFIDLPSFYSTLTTKSRVAKDPTLMKGFKSTFSMKAFAQKTIEGARQGSFLLLRQYEKDGRQRLLFRLMTATGITYQDYPLIKINNTIKADDVFSYTNGEDMTTTLADAIDVMVPEGDLETGAKRADSLVRLKKLQERGDNQGIKDLYERLPVSMQETKGFLILYMEACKNTDRAAYKAAVERLSTLFPQIPSAYLLLIDISTEAKDYKKALFAIDKINEIIGAGGDPYLDFFKGNIHNMMGKPAEAKAYFEKLYAFDPELRSNLGALITAYVTSNEIDKAKKLVDTYKTSKIFNQAELDLVYENYPVLK